tara:strand:- start:642 stop:776 length:135 start_codon:yes stop_codon:yes gene_type:complete
MDDLTEAQVIAEYDAMRMASQQLQDEDMILDDIPDYDVDSQWYE